MRKTKLTPEVASKIVGLITIGNYRKHAAAAAGVSESTMRAWMRWGEQENAKEPYKSFAERVHLAEGAAIANSVLHIHTAAAGGDWRAAAWLIAKKAREEWGDPAKQQQAVSQQLELFLQVVDELLGKDTAQRIYREFVRRARRHGRGATGGAGRPGGGGSKPLH